MDLWTFAQKSSHIEICFISRLKLGHKLLNSKNEKTNKTKTKRGGHRICFGEKGKGKMLLLIRRKSQKLYVRAKVTVHRNTGVGFLDNCMPLGMS